MPFIILTDTREKSGIWDFSFSSECLEQRTCTLSTGDYTLLGYENILAIERKKTVDEIATNLGQKWETFTKELIRLKEYKYRYIVCEFSIDDLLAFPKNSTSKYKRKISGKFLLSRLNKISEEYGIEILYCGDKYNAEQTVLEIFKNVHK